MANALLNGIQNEMLHVISGFGTSSSSGHGPTFDLKGLSWGGKRGGKNVREGFVG